eukprot:ctg_1307.g427
MGFVNLFAPLQRSQSHAQTCIRPSSLSTRSRRPRFSFSMLFHWGARAATEQRRKALERLFQERGRRLLRLSAPGDAYRRCGYRGADRLLPPHAARRYRSAGSVFVVGVAPAGHVSRSSCRRIGNERRGVAAQPAVDRMGGVRPESAAATAVQRRLLRLCHVRGVGRLPHPAAGGVPGDRTGVAARRHVHRVAVQSVFHAKGHRAVALHQRRGARVHHRVVLSLRGRF